MCLEWSLSIIKKHASARDSKNSVLGTDTLLILQRLLMTDVIVKISSDFSIESELLKSNNLNIN